MQIATERGACDQMLVKCCLCYPLVVKKGKKIYLNVNELLLTSTIYMFPCMVIRHMYHVDLKAWILNSAESLPFPKFSSYISDSCSLSSVLFTLYNTIA